MPKPNKQHIINELIKHIEQGKAYKTALAVSVSKWHLSERTFNRYWKIANQQHTDAQAIIKKELAALNTQRAIESRKKAIMTADERKEYLTKIISGKIKFKRPIVVGGIIKDHPSEPDAMERLKAIAELNKMEGDYSAQKIDVKTESKPSAIDYSKLSDAALTEIANAKIK